MAVHCTFQYGANPGKRNRLREAMLFEDPPEYYTGGAGGLGAGLGGGGVGDGGGALRPPHLHLHVATQQHTFSNAQAASVPPAS